MLLSCRYSKRETNDATTDPVCLHRQRQHWSASRGAAGQMSEATVAAKIVKVKEKVNSVGRHEPVVSCLSFFFSY